MAEKNVDAQKCSIALMEPRDALELGRMYRTEIPWAIFSIMGDRFTARFIEWIHQQENSRVWVAKNETGQILGISAGTLDKPRIYRKIVREHWPTLVRSVLLNLYRPAVLRWLWRAVWEKVRPVPEVWRSAPRPAAEWLLLTVVEKARGTGLAARLRERMEADFREWGLQGPYMMLPLATNQASLAFLKKQGGRLVAEVSTRGHVIHELHKELPLDGT
ncbi:MAG: hypothetical protein V2A79_01880 [Planctomycetota bacterium]